MLRHGAPCRVMSSPHHPPGELEHPAMNPTTPTTPATVAQVGNGRKIHALHVLGQRADGTYRYMTQCGAERRNIASRGISQLRVSVTGTVDCGACLRSMAPAAAAAPAVEQDAVQLEDATVAAAHAEALVEDAAHDAATAAAQPLVGELAQRLVQGVPMWGDRNLAAQPLTKPERDAVSDAVDLANQLLQEAHDAGDDPCVNCGRDLAEHDSNDLATCQREHDAHLRAMPRPLRHRVQRSRMLGLRQP